MNSNTAGPVDRAAPRVTPQQPTRGVVINMDEGVGATRDATRGAAGAPSPFSRSGRSLYWLRGQLKAVPPLSPIQRTAAACGNGRDESYQRDEVCGTHPDARACVCERKRVRRRWHAKSGETISSTDRRRTGLLMIFRAPPPCLRDDTNACGYSNEFPTRFDDTFFTNTRQIPVRS